ncbi:ferritin-like domain-containing protein [Heyndrickxia sporothermodurans]|uniref:Ferritin-like domain-containing protein n=1 Tax=Heyndrickxia vini TaxID=1476025 RepID=A0ABX7E549_9BACI|nr:MULTISPECIES: ferritin-like domain-containing protein [Heyndrickxia]MBL5766390.1 ferritin-like domain-containing protein [Heyndrickxia sporothermodurans]MBL5769829.1 ferritin-like domain-containing protein [Heyndrickxia sporothermodurans]MBL5776908.1 ferritin-like domain-containing protein [Heyndrickxia sporothermodurans]MBL5782579.1 ferritin-like domain-containing protein [Heyndrickxia sporothermodurans]MBL5784198.1 ferritin-like domain-containing protein [Heyndrickxia sporothermodurans]
MEKEMKELIDGLNEDLSGEYSAAIQYTYYASAVQGLYYQILKPMFEKEIPDEQGHALYLSEKIINLGGQPTTKPAEVKPVTDAKEMLEEARKAEEQTIARYKVRREQADKLGLIELVVKLEDIISDETRHMEEMQRLLNDPRFS